MSFEFMLLPKLVQQYIYNFLDTKNQLNFRKVCKKLYETLKIYTFVEYSYIRIIPYEFLKTSVFSNIKVLAIRNSKYTGETINKILSLPFTSFLKSLYIYPKYILTSENVRNLKNLKSLRCFDFNDFNDLDYLKKIKYLSITSYNTCVYNLNAIKNIKILTCSRTEPTDLNNLVNLKELNIPNNNFTNESLNKLDLHKIYFYKKTNITSIKNFKNLRCIIFHVFNKYIIKELPEMPKLKKIAFCEFSIIKQKYIDALYNYIKQINIYIVDSYACIALEESIEIITSKNKITVFNIKECFQIQKQLSTKIKILLK